MTEYKTFREMKIEEFEAKQEIIRVKLSKSISCPKQIKEDASFLWDKQISLERMIMFQDEIQRVCLAAKAYAAILESGCWKEVK